MRLRQPCSHAHLFISSDALHGLNEKLYVQTTQGTVRGGKGSSLEAVARQGEAPADDLAHAEPGKHFRRKAGVDGGLRMSE